MFIPLSTRIIAMPCLLLLPLLRPDSMKPWQEWKVWSERGRMPSPEKRGQRRQWRVFWWIWGKRTSLTKSSARSFHSTEVRENDNYRSVHSSPRSSLHACILMPKDTKLPWVLLIGWGRKHFSQELGSTCSLRWQKMEPPLHRSNRSIKIVFVKFTLFPYASSP